MRCKDSDFFDKSNKKGKYLLIFLLISSKKPIFAAQKEQKSTIKYKNIMHHLISFILRIAYAGAFAYILIWHTDDIIRYIPQLLGGMLMLECVAQLLELFYLKAKTSVASGFFLIPSLILIYGLFLIFCCSIEVDPNARIQEIFSPSAGFSMLTLDMQMGGWCCLAFIISEIVISIAFFKPLYRPAKFAEERRQQLEAQRALEAERARQAEKARQEAAAAAAASASSSTEAKQ